MTDEEQITFVDEPVEGSGELLVSVEDGPPMRLFAYSTEQVLGLIAKMADRPMTRDTYRGLFARPGATWRLGLGEIINSLPKRRANSRCRSGVAQFNPL